jgi:hypothetical protein
MGKIRKAVAEAAANLLAREGNESLSAEDLAEELAREVTETVVSAYEEIQSKAYNLIILGHFRISETESFAAAVGPLSTRAPMRARGMGERFAWDYKTRKGTGKYVLVPLVRNPNEAWDEVRAQQVQALKDGPLRGALSLDPYGPACVCGLDRGGELICPRHPEGRD